MFDKVLKQGALTLSLVMTLVACGGGGGDPSVPNNLPTDDDLTATLTFTVVDPDTGRATNILNTADGNEININLVDGNGAPLAGEFVSITSTIGTISPADGQVLTDVDGNATASIASAGIDAGTAGILTVRFNNAELGASDTATLNIQVGNTITGGGGAGSVIALSVTLYDQREYDLDPSDATAATTASEIDRINVVQPATLEARLLLDGAPVDNAIIEVSTDLGTLSPASGRIITNELGIATLGLSVGNAISGDAGTISISAAGADQRLSFGVGSATLQLGTGSGADFMVSALGISDNTLSASGNTGVFVNVVNVVDASNVLFTTPVEVSFTSGCVVSGDASIDSPVTTAGGVATASYSVLGCENSDTITAEIVGVAGPSANGEVSIIASIPNSIAFTGANPENISLEGTGGDGRVENSDVTFQIIDNTGAPEAGVIVNFSLTTTTGGITLVDDTAQSDATGIVTAKVSSGNIPTPVRVVATISLDATGNSVADVDGDGVDDNDPNVAVAETISTVSDVLVISTGLPDQNSFTIGAEVLNVGGGDENGIETTVSVRAADKFNNPVPDGTAITFITEFGAIDPSCTTLDGACGITWRSQNPRAHTSDPADDLSVTPCVYPAEPPAESRTTLGIPCRAADFAPFLGSGSTVVAYALGEENFIDDNGNGLFDFVDDNGNGLFDFVDDNGNGLFDPGERFVDDNDNGSFDPGEYFVDDNGNGLFDPGESGEHRERYVDLPEVFLDHNEDGVFGNLNTVGSCFNTEDCPAYWRPRGGREETFIDFNSNREYDHADGIYNGSLCSDAAEAAGLCTTNLLNVAASLQLIMSNQRPFFGLYLYSDGAFDLIGGRSPVGLSQENGVSIEGIPAIDIRSDIDVNDDDGMFDVANGDIDRNGNGVFDENGSANLRIDISDRFNGPLPHRTTVAVSSNNCKIDSPTDFEFSAADNTFLTIPISLSEDTAMDSNRGEVTVTVTAPSLITAFSFQCLDNN